MRQRRFPYVERAMERYHCAMGTVVHISEEEAVREPVALFDQVKAGDNILIHTVGQPDVTVRLTRTLTGKRFIRIALAPKTSVLGTTILNPEIP